MFFMSRFTEGTFRIVTTSRKGAKNMDKFLSSLRKLWNVNTMLGKDKASILYRLFHLTGYRP